MKFLKWGTVALVALLGAAALTLLIVDQRPLRVDPKAVIEKAARYDVRIRRDEFGVPHIKGRRDADVAFGLGFAHSEDDLATIETVALATRGALAGVEGLKAAPTDYLVHAFRVWEDIDANYGDLPQDLREVLEAYADGVSYYAALHPERIAEGLIPLSGKDIAAGFMFKTPFFYGLDETLRKLTKDTKGAPMPPIGSNGVAVAPARSADGATRLLVNSHQPYSGPVAWYEAVLESAAGWHVAGGFFPGSPFMLHGHNERLGWANTVNKPDLIDIYELKINPANADQYLLDGAWRDFEHREARIRVHLFGPFFWTAHRAVQFSEHGPVFRTDHGVFAIRYAGMRETRQALQYYRLNKARDRTEWLAAMRLQALPSINYVYADGAGNIGFVHNGLYPDRIAGVDWQKTLPGDRGDLIWRHYLPFERVPQIWNPRSGLVFNSNNTPFRAGADEEDLRAEDFPPTMGLQRNMTNRAWRALETFGTDPKITEEKFRAYKFDLTYSVQSDVARWVKEALDIDASADAGLKDAQAVLARWDLKTDRADRGAALGVLTCRRISKGMPARDALKEASAFLLSQFGRLDPEWGAVNRLRRGALDLAIDGGPDIFRAVEGEADPDGRLRGMGGDGLIMFVAFDREGRVSSSSVHQFGSATLDATSRHYADQSPLFVEMKTKPVLFNEAELAGHIEADYRPGEAHH